MCAAVSSTLSPASSESDNPFLDFLLRTTEQQQLATAMEELQHIDDAAYYHRIIRERECELERLRKRREELKESETAMWAYSEAISITEKQRLQYVVDLSRLLVDPQTFILEQPVRVMRWITEMQRRLGVQGATFAATTSSTAAATSAVPVSISTTAPSTTPAPPSTTSAAEEDGEEQEEEQGVQSHLLPSHPSLQHRRPHHQCGV